MSSRWKVLALFCVGTASAFGWILAYYKIPEVVLTGVSAWGMGIVATGFFIVFVFLVAGTFLDSIPAIVMYRHSCRLPEHCGHPGGSSGRGIK